MKILKSLSLTALSVVLFAPHGAQAAYESRDGFYVDGGFISSFQRDADSKISGEKSKIKSESGWGVTGAGGYAWANGLRSELELTVRTSDVDRVTGAGSHPVTDGTLRNTSAMVNAMYDIATGTRLTPYVGAGLGASFVEADDIRTVNDRRISDDKTSFAYQGIAGVTASLDDNWAIKADYRYFATPDAKFKTDASGVSAKTENDSHNIMIKLSYKFGGAEPAPVRAPAQVAAQPVAQPGYAQPVAPDVAQSYLVFFDFDKSVLTPEAKNIITAAAKDFKAGKYIRVVVTGHTDTMGSVKYNQKLSEHRAMAVKKEFQNLGVSPKVVMTVGEGKNALLIPTADGVREAQNRRAEIVLAK